MFKNINGYRFFDVKTKIKFNKLFSRYMSHIPTKESEIDQLQKWHFFLKFNKKSTKNNSFSL